MWTRAELKDRAKEALSHNYWKLVLVALIANVVEGVSNTLELEYKTDGSGMSVGILGVLESGLVGMAPLFIMGALAIVVIGIVIGIFVMNPLEVGTKRFFTMSHAQKPEFKELLFAFDHGYKNVVKILLIRDIKVFLWSLLFVIPGIIKGLEYRMIPYLLGENPDLTEEEAFRLSKQMMDGQKAEAFVLDLSFIGWEFLSSLTWGILGIFYVSPYVHLTDAALYETLSSMHGRPARSAGMQQEWTDSYTQTEYEEI